MSNYRERFTKILSDLLASGQYRKIDIRRKAKISASQLDGYLEGKNAPHLDTAQRILESLGVPAGALTRGDNPVAFATPLETAHEMIQGLQAQAKEQEAKIRQLERLAAAQDAEIQALKAAQGSAIDALAQLVSQIAPKDRGDVERMLKAYLRSRNQAKDGSGSETA